MKAAQIMDYGNNVEIIETKKPVPDVGQVLIRVKATSINPVDLAIQNGYMKVPLPTTLGVDFAGTIAEVGGEVEGFKEGDEVYGNAGPFRQGTGAFAEFLITNFKNIAKKPKSLKFTDSATLPLVGTSAIQAIEEIMKLQKDQKIFIRGGGGGIGSIAIQVAKALGAYVATTASDDDIEYVKSIGADEVYDKQAPLPLKDYDAAFETAKADTNKLFDIVKPGGMIVSMVGEPDQKLAEKKEIIAIGMMSSVTTYQLERLAKLIDSRKVKIRIAKVFKFDEINDAFDFFSQGHTKGKVAIEMS